MSEFSYKTLGSILQFSRGFDITKKQQTDGSIPVISSSGISSYNSAYKCEGPGVITGRKGTLGKVFFSNTNYWPHDTTLWVKDFKGNNPKFLYYLLSQMQLEVFDVGASNPTLNRNHLHKIQVQFPTDLEVQNSIVRIIDAYDEFIEVNSQRIKLFEETARELYKEWFVRMRFPGYKKTKFSKGIPADWRIRPIGEVIDYHIGGGWGNDVPDDYFNTSGYVIRGTDIPGIKLGTTNRDVYRFHKASNMKSRELLEGDIVFETAGGSEGQPLGRTCFITQELLDAYGDKVMAASFCKQIRTNSIPSLYLYYFLNYLYDSGLIEAFQTQSTGISNYQFGPFLKFQQIIIPNENLMQEFHNIALTIQKQIAILGQQNTELRQTRDRLLPRLIGGKLQVKLNTDCNTTKSTESLQVIDKPEKSTEDTKLKSNPFFQRRVLATHIIDRLKDEPTFGHVKLMKLMYLCEHLAEIETASHYHRDAAGPYDNRMIRSIDSQLKKAQWFECKKTGNRYLYTALPKKEEYKNWFSKYYSDKEAGIENLLHLFGKEKTEKAEMVATLYEVWRDLKDKKQLPTEQAIIYEVLNNWHESKQRISEERWLKCLQWMKEKNWIT
ncbi:restriction endonuclease subunit S [Chryseobacterium gambrini]|uniref:restriction endonuclease subunit S n=1 Tax=Chryseobacterium gambrini TaxID=373672 RepID=UPI003D0C5B6D